MSFTPPKACYARICNNYNANNSVAEEEGEDEEMHHPDQDQHEVDMPGFDFYFDTECNEECYGEFWHEMNHQS
eukprot:11584379-Ditylum_brightwellii.AAC.1